MAKNEVNTLKSVEKPTTTTSKECSEMKMNVVILS